MLNPSFTALALLLALAPACGVDPETSSTAQALEAPPPGADHLALWLDAARGVTLSRTGEVLAWEDQSGHGVVLGRGSPELPSITVAKFPATDRPGLLFRPPSAQGGGYLVNSAFALRQPMTMVVALYPLVGGRDVTPIGGIVAPTLALTSLVDQSLIPQTNDLRATSGAGSTYRAVSVPRAWSNDARFAIAVFDGASSSTSVLGAGRASGTLGTDPLVGIALSHGGRTFAGYIGDVLIYDTALDRTTLAEVTAYLAARYAAP